MLGKSAPFLPNLGKISRGPLLAFAKGWQNRLFFAKHWQNPENAIPP